MNAKAALSSMLIGVTSFVGITELERAGLFSLPLFLDPLMIAFAISVISLVAVALFTNPNEQEVGYFEQIKNSSASKMTIKQVLSEPNGFAKLKKEYRQIYVIAIGFVVLSVVLWGYLFINLGL